MCNAHDDALHRSTLLSRSTSPLRCTALHTVMNGATHQHRLAKVIDSIDSIGLPSLLTTANQNRKLKYH